MTPKEAYEARKADRKARLANASYRGSNSAERDTEVADMLAEPHHFTDNTTDDEMTPDRAKAICDAHVAKGGALTDKMVSP